MAETSLRINWQLFNIIILGVAFMLLFAAFQTAGMVEKSVLESVKNETQGEYTGDGYTSLAIIYVVFAVANWAAPSVVSVCGPKWSMIIGGVLYSLFIFQFLKPMTWALYVGSVLVGLGAAVIWTGQGNFLTINSNSETIGRNSGIFWALLQCSLLFGNLYVYIAFRGEVNISPSTRMQLFIVLTVSSVLGVLCLLLLRSKTSSTANVDTLLDNTGESIEQKPDGPLIALKNSFRLLMTKDMLLLAVCFAYTGFELTFFSGVYGTSVGHTRQLGDAALSYIGLCGVFIGVGEIFGGGLFGLLGAKTNRYGRDPIVLLGYFSHMATFYMIYINLPADSPLDETNHPAIMHSNKYIAIVCAFLLGFGDSSFNTQIFSLLGFVYTEDSAPAFALFKFVQSVAAAVAFFYSTYLQLQWQLLILVVFGTLGAFSFFVVEWSSTRITRAGYKHI